MLILLELAAIVDARAIFSFDREFLHQVRGITHFDLLRGLGYLLPFVIILSCLWLSFLSGL